MTESAHDDTSQKSGGLADMTSFVSLAAQASNLGDLVIRRVMFDWLWHHTREHHVFIGDSSMAFVNAFDLPPGAVLHASAPRFMRELLRNRGDAAFAVSPGPTTRTPAADATARAALNLALATTVKRAGGAVLALGRAVRGSESLSLRAERKLASIADEYWLRDQTSVDLVGAGQRLPDLAFAAAEPFAWPHSKSDRQAVAVSLRSDSSVSHSFLEQLVKAIRRAGMSPVFVTQVEHDDEQHIALAAKLGVEAVLWQSRDHREQLDRVVNAYSQCAMVISNRLHGLIFGALCGAAVAPLVSPANDKLESTLRGVVPYLSINPELPAPADLFQPTEAYLATTALSVTAARNELFSSLDAAAASFNNRR